MKQLIETIVKPLVDYPEKFGLRKTKMQID